MKIFWPEMHNTISRSIALALETFGATMLLPDPSFNSVIGYGRKYTKEEVKNLFPANVEAVSVEELFDAQPDIVFATCYENMHDVLRNVWPHVNQSKSKLAMYNGNDQTPIDFGVMRNILSTDVITTARAKLAGCHYLYYFPWVDYETFCYRGPSDNPIFRSYIQNYAQLFPQGFQLATLCSTLTPGIEFQFVENTPKAETPRLMRDSMATIHCKPLEGYGFAIVESLACGRPVILFRPWSKDRSYANWCIDGQSAFYFSDQGEYADKIRNFLFDRSFRHSIQKKTAETVRRVINNEEQTVRLKKFLEELV